MFDYSKRKPKLVNYGERLQVRISKELLERLDKISKNLNTEKSSLIRDAVEMYLNALDKN